MSVMFIELYLQSKTYCIYSITQDIAMLVVRCPIYAFVINKIKSWTDLNVL